jgi:hypothetical protein
MNPKLKLPRHQINVGFAPDMEFESVIQQCRLARAESAIVGLKLPLIARWRRGIRYSYTPGYLVTLNPHTLLRQCGAGR